MDGLMITCRECGARTSFEDADSHVCRARPLQQYTNNGGGTEGYGDPRRNQSPPTQQFSSNRSEVNMRVGNRNPYPARSDVQGYAEPPKGAVRDDLTLGPNFDISALRAPHSYDGPYGSLNNGPNPRPGRPPPSQLDLRRPPQMQRNGSRTGPQYEQPRQQAPPPPRQRYMDDYDYSRPNPPPPQRMLPPQDNQYPPNRPYGNENLNSPLFNRNRAPAPEQYREPERQFPDQRPPEPRYQNYGGMGFRGRSEERYDSRDYDPPVRRVSPTRSEPRGPPPSMRASKDQQADPNVDEMEIWRQIRSQAQQKNRSTSSSHSSTDSGETRSRRSDNTPPSSAASPISPSKHPDYQLVGSPLKITTNGLEKLEHNRKGSDSSPTKVTLPVCRACDEPIRGRSLASQDGKLSGRYHKHCFCCTTCQKPFETASFYVFQDRPYCKQHYHELNHSMCADCGEGVEGQCLQLEDATIRHPDCFTCHTCHVQLDEDYYESNGMPYCDRHARMLRKTDQRMEKRKTRVLMM